jgi:hypothetical protein
MDNPKSIELIQWLSKYESNSSDNNKNTITLICFCENEKKCHRSIIKEMALSYNLPEKQR